MKIWVLLVFSFVNEPVLLKHEFYTQEACLQAAKPLQENMQAIIGSPRERGTIIQCVEDLKPVK